MRLDVDQREADVMVKHYDTMRAIILNRPRAIHALTTEMIRLIRQALDEAEAKNRFQFVLLSGTGSRGFCAGGDIKTLAKAVREKTFWRAELFPHDGGKYQSPSPRGKASQKMHQFIQILWGDISEADASPVISPILCEINIRPDYLHLRLYGFQRCSRREK